MIQIGLVHQQIISTLTGSWVVKCLVKENIWWHLKEHELLILCCTWQVVPVSSQIKHLTFKVAQPEHLSVAVKRLSITPLHYLCVSSAALRHHSSRTSGFGYSSFSSPRLAGSPVELVRDCQRGQMCMLSDYVMTEQGSQTERLSNGKKFYCVSAIWKQSESIKSIWTKLYASDSSLSGIWL